jgi:hypothetical protein
MDLLLVVCAGIAVVGLLLSAVATRSSTSESGAKLPESETASVA